MNEKRLKLWLKNIFNSEIREIKRRLIDHFIFIYDSRNVKHIKLVEESEKGMIFLVYYTGKYPCRPTPYVAFLVDSDTGKIVELSEKEAVRYRPKNYK